MTDKVGNSDMLIGAMIGGALTYALVEKQDCKLAGKEKEKEKQAKLEYIYHAKIGRCSKPNKERCDTCPYKKDEKLLDW